MKIWKTGLACIMAIMLVTACGGGAAENEAESAPETESTAEENTESETESKEGVPIDYTYPTDEPEEPDDSYAEIPDSEPAETESDAPVDEEELRAQTEETISAAGYESIQGNSYQANILRYPENPQWMMSDYTDFDTGYLGYAIHDFDADGAFELLMLTVESERLVEEDDLGSYESYDFRLHMFELGEDMGWTQQDEISLPVSILPIESKCDFFYKDYEGDKTGIFFNMAGEEWIDDGAYGSLVKYAYDGSSFQVMNDVLADYPGDVGFTMDEGKILDSMGQDALASWQSFGFAISSTDDGAPMIMEQDNTCVPLARIQSSTSVTYEDAMAADDLDGALTYTIIGY